MGNAASKTDEKKSFTSMTKECRQAREKVGAAREKYLAKDRKKLDKDNFDQPEERLSDDETKKFKYPFENLVLEGGGIKGIAYVGLIKVLEEHGISQQIKRYAGTSAGSIVAASLAVGFNSYDIKEILKVDFNKLLYDAGWMSYITNLLYSYGLNPGNKFYKFLGDLLALKTGDPDITFEELYKRYHKELCIVTVNVDTSEELYCHVKTTPEMPIRLAVRMSMSIPGLFTPVKISQNNTASHFIDGGLYVNYPVHCYDGWFLSMTREDSFLKKIQPIDKIQELMDIDNRFQYDPDQKTTIGAVVFSERENELHRNMLKKTRINLQGKLPETKLARTHIKHLTQKTYRTKDAKKITAAVDGFFKILDEKNRNEDDVITVDEFKAAFNNKSFSEDSQKVLFGEGCDVDTAFTSVDKNGNKKITFTDLISFVESTGILVFETLNDHQRLDTTSVTKYFGSMISGLNSYAGKVNYHSRDVDRTIGISSWYITTTDFDLEEGDIQLLIKEGAGSTRKFLKNYVDGNSLEQLSDAETSIRNGEVPKGMSVSDKDVAQILRI